ncbi:MAG: methyltransferase domain-containing protein [Pseudomonadota bacterium]
MVAYDPHRAPMTGPPQVFDRRAVRRHRDRAAAGFHAHDFLFREIGERLVERLDDVTRRFPRVLDVGCRTGLVRGLLGGRADVETVVGIDLSARMVARAGAPSVVGDEEMLPFADGSFDLVISNLALHWTNDLPGALVQLRRALKPDGLLLAAMFGGETLIDLRAALIDADLAESGGAFPRVSPVADLRDAGMLLQRAGFELPVVDGDTVSVSYPDATALMRDLRGMGETNAVVERQRSLARRGLLVRAAAAYPRQPDGRIAAGFQVIFLTGWAPHASQPKPLRPGSATTRLADALDSRERGTGEKAAPDKR